MQIWLRRHSGIFLLLAAIFVLAVRFSFSPWLFFLFVSALLSLGLALVGSLELKSGLEAAEKSLKEAEGQRLFLQDKVEELTSKLTEAKELNLSLHRSVQEAVDKVREVEQNDHLQNEAFVYAHLLKHQQKQLRNQFEEKQQELDTARKSLFSLEGQVTCLEKQNEEIRLSQKEQEQSQEALTLDALEEKSQLAFEVEELESLVSTLGTPKKRAALKKKSVSSEQPTLGL